MTSERQVRIDWDDKIVRREIREDGWHVGYYADGTIGELVHPDTYRRLEKLLGTSVQPQPIDPPQPPQTP